LFGEFHHQLHDEDSELGEVGETRRATSVRVSRFLPWLHKAQTIYQVRNLNANKTQQVTSPPQVNFSVSTVTERNPVKREHEALLNSL